MNRDETAKLISRMASRAWWAGAIVGVILGLLIGLAIGYSLGSPTNLIVPLTQGIRT